MYYFWLLANLKEAFAVEKPRQAASSSSDKRKITKNKKYRDDSLSSPPSLPMKPIEEELIEIHADQNSETSNLALLLLLPHMVGPVHLKRKRISAAEVRQSFISHIEEPTKILEERQKRQARICRVKKDVMKVQTYADEALLRCDTDYEADVLEGIPANSGVKEKCVWIMVNGFRLFEQVGVDIMHDILEGEEAMSSSTPKGSKTWTRQGAISYRFPAASRRA
ncbi:hypothetical protein MSG28_003635 [Choristoneura fumiferana]|uniref:Uncharacterized protein n=1 Tax=Choristoneura fumiferana TaxID=7141 RepID=A0ACC0KFM4_CHOFU|nr:hypothetical protein MSG28_003635 [Choristoneura fumiferana]